MTSLLRANSVGVGVIIDKDEESVDIPLPLDVVDGLKGNPAFQPRENRPEADLSNDNEGLEEPSLDIPQGPVDRHAAHLKRHIAGGHGHR
jgi:hypothetical protein